MVNFREKIENLLQENMTERGFKLWKGIDKRLPDTWQRPTSSTGKYHKTLDGRVPNQAEHVYHLVYSMVKLFKMLDVKKKTPDADKLLFACVLHDSLKYGTLGTRKHTDNKHDREAADMIAQNRETFLKILTEKQCNVLEEMVRFHSGRWSTDVDKSQPFDFKNYSPEVLVIHMLDMMSAADLIQTDVR